MRTGDGEIYVKFATLQQGGSQIHQDAQTNAEQVNKDWQKFTHPLVKGGNLPTCLYTALNDFADYMKPELDHLFQRREDIGDGLKKASDLVDFADKAVGSSFADLYSSQPGYYSNSNNFIPDYWQQPDLFPNGKKPK